MFNLNFLVEFRTPKISEARARRLEKGLGFRNSGLSPDFVHLYFHSPRTITGMLYFNYISLDVFSNMNFSDNILREPPSFISKASIPKIVLATKCKSVGGDKVLTTQTSRHYELRRSLIARKGSGSHRIKKKQDSK